METAAQTPGLGFAHFLSQADTLGHVLLGLLLVMSVVTWYLIVSRAIAHAVLNRQSRAFAESFWNASTLDAVEAELERRSPQDPLGRLAVRAITAAHHHRHHGVQRLGETGTQAEFVTRAIRRSIDEETARLESGLTTLASIGSTAPFIGLFGTVWGVYHALINIGTAAQSTLDQVAGPVGEALIMTGLGLAVAIPAVLAYNYAVRRNRVMLAQLDAFAHDLFALLATGCPVPAVPADRVFAKAA